MAYTRQEYQFDLKLVMDCISAYSTTTGLGCTVSDGQGIVLHECGAGCKSCGVCKAVGHKEDGCSNLHFYKASDAERFGGKYIYFCPMGLTSFVTPVTGVGGSKAAMITVGPFLMVDRDDYVTYDLRQRLALSDASISRISECLESMPYVAPQRVNALSTVLLMQVGFVNHVSSASRVVELRDLDDMQNQVTNYMIKRKGAASAYPINTEKKFLACMAESDRPKARKLLNKLLGHIFFASEDDLELIKAKTYDLLVIISRVAINVGVSSEQAMRLNHRFWKQVQSAEDIDGLCAFLTAIINRYIDNIFNLSEKKRTDIAYKAASYMKRNCVKKITLVDVANAVYLSPTYFSKVFKREMGCGFNAYLNQLRIDKSKELLEEGNMQLAQIASYVGFEDQSYFTKVFTRIVGTTPGDFRKAHGRI